MSLTSTAKQSFCFAFKEPLPVIVKFPFSWTEIKDHVSIPSVSFQISVVFEISLPFKSNVKVFVTVNWFVNSISFFNTIFELFEALVTAVVNCASVET